MSYLISRMNPEEAMAEAVDLFKKGYRITSRKFGIISRVDISDEEMVAMFIKNNFGDTTSGVPCMDLEHQKDFYRRVHSKDKKTVDACVLRYIGDLTSYDLYA